MQRIRRHQHWRVSRICPNMPVRSRVEAAGLPRQRRRAYRLPINGFGEERIDNDFFVGKALAGTCALCI